MTRELPPDIQAMFDEIVGGDPAMSLEQMNAALAQRTAAYNARPQKELGGLSPDQAARILYGDWQSTGALRVAGDVSLGELAAADIFHDARTVLSFLRDEGPAPATQKGNLARVAVRTIAPRLRSIRSAFVREEVEARQVLNEGDILDLEVLRHALTFAGLVMRRKGFRITKLGKTLLADDRAGELYALLFRTFFRNLDLRVLDRSDRHAGLQSTIAFSFYKLRSSAASWASPEALANEAWLESARDPLTQSELQYGDQRHWSFHHRVLAPLAAFGLLERRELPSEDKWSKPVEFRVSPLFDRFFRFDLGR